MNLTHEEIVEIGKIASMFAMFGSVLVILRWFKSDTADMIKLYSETTKAQVDAIKEDVKAIKEDVKDFHRRLCEIEEKGKAK